jgi:DNA-binding NarL/FixJ family response regulator
MHTVKAFVVEDSPIILDQLVAALEELAPVEVVGSAPDEAAAVQWLTEPDNWCDLVIIDIFLKSGSGLGVLKSAAKVGRSGKRVVLTNYATPDMREHCAGRGAARALHKSRQRAHLIY